MHVVECKFNLISFSETSKTAGFGFQLRPYMSTTFRQHIRHDLPSLRHELADCKQVACSHTSSRVYSTNSKRDSMHHSMLSDFFAVPSNGASVDSVGYRDTQETYCFVRVMGSLRAEDNTRGCQKANWWMLIISERLPV